MVLFSPGWPHPQGETCTPKNGHAYKTWVLLSPPHRPLCVLDWQRRGENKRAGGNDGPPRFWMACLSSREQGWRSGESARLPPMWPAFKSWRRRHMWVEFVVGSLPCSERFFSGYSGFPSPQKPTLPNSNSIWNARTRLNEFIWTLKCFMGKKAIYNLLFFLKHQVTARDLRCLRLCEGSGCTQ